MMATHEHAPSNDIHDRLNALKFRISTKKNTAHVMFDDILSENTDCTRMKSPLETIRDVLKKQQEQEGNLDSNKFN